jgi:AraC-like DNA-binding protein
VGPAIGCLLTGRDIDAAGVVADADMPSTVLEQDVSIPLQTARSFVDRAARILDMPLLGVELAAMLPAGALGIAESIMRAAPTVADAMRALADYAALVDPSLSLRIDDEGSLMLSLAGERDGFGAHLNELWIAYIMRLVETLVERSITFERVWFSHTRTGGPAIEIAHRMRCPVRFQAADCGLKIPHSLLCEVPVAADANTYAYLRHEADRHLASLASDEIITHVQRAIESRLGNASELDVACSMALSRRTLQRYLAAAGTSFRALRNEVRKRRRAVLAAGGVDDAVIAASLGFSDARAMRRSLDAA